MSQIPDAPWIREAEQDGYPPWDAVKCPICGEECETIFRDISGNVVGCEQCLTKQDSYEWAEEEKEADRDGWDDER